ncbi:hypothetical protein GW17_00053697 [Ensete ventricosum]|nr:hypothetical protein GW17_00053697 [Ensete ventricosum]RZS26257.1 hypothetical protein BHM03_00059578 [Ensete ventricosum]
MVVRGGSSDNAVTESWCCSKGRRSSWWQRRQGQWQDGASAVDGAKSGKRVATRNNDDQRLWQGRRDKDEGRSWGLTKDRCYGLLKAALVAIVD